MLPYKTGKVRVSSNFGNRILNGANNYHPGIDLVGDTDKTVVSVTDGVVIQSRIVTDTSNATSQWGNYICIQGKDGYYYYYCHLSARKVSQWQSVKAGEVIGIEGNTGYSFGSHLHFEVRKGSAIGTSVNPCPFIGIENTVGSVYTVGATAAAAEAKPNTVTESSAKQIAKENGASDFAINPVVWALENGIIFGDGDGNLMLKDNITREQMLTFLYRLNKLWEGKQ